MSTLLQLRQQVIEKSGRFELVSDYEGADYSDNGADFFIQAGQRYLDLTQENPHSRAEYKVDIASGDYYARIPYLRAVEEVWLFDASDDARIQLEPKTLTEMKTKYTNEFSETDTGTPECYTEDVINLAPSQNVYSTVALMQAAVDASTAPFTADFQNVLAESAFTQRGLLFGPPADAVYTLSVTGFFFSKFTADTDITYWSSQHPELSLFATLFMMEAFHRNSTGMRDWENAMGPFIRGIDNDEVRRDMTLAGTQMKG